MTQLAPANGLSIETAPSGGIFDDMLGELKYLGSALRANLAPAPTPANDVAPSFDDQHDHGPAPSFAPKPRM
jgi:hypothetical protein